jgi:uncharacterized CHY-type Zn-finger protein
MMHSAAVLAVLFLLVFGALRVGHRRPARPEPAPRDRIAWRAYLSEPPNPCDTGHTRLYLSGPSAESSGVICSVCTTELTRPEWMDCPECRWFPVAEKLHVVHCATHTEPADPQQEAA